VALAVEFRQLVEVVMKAQRNSGVQDCFVVAFLSKKKLVCSKV